MVVTAILRHWDQSQLGGVGGTLGYFLAGQPVEIEGQIQGGGVFISALKGPGTLLALLICLIGGLTLLNVGLRNVGKSIYYAVIDRMRKPAVKANPGHESGQHTPPQLRHQSHSPRPTTSVDEVTKRIAAVSAGSSLDANDLVERIRKRRRRIRRNRRGRISGTQANVDHSRQSTDSYSERHATEMESLGPIEDQKEIPKTPCRPTRRHAQRHGRT